MMCSLAFGKVYLDLSFINWDVASPSQNSAKDRRYFFKLENLKSSRKQKLQAQVASLQYGQLSLRKLGT